MRFLLFGFLVLLISLPTDCMGQVVFHTGELFSKGNSDAVWRSVIAEDKHASLFLIEVDKEVPLHLHKEHSEIVFVLKGKGKVSLGQEQHRIKKGDLIWIPQGTVHGASVISRSSMQVISIQCPKWNPEDRFFINKSK